MFGRKSSILLMNADDEYEGTVIIKQNIFYININNR